MYGLDKNLENIEKKNHNYFKPLYVCALTLRAITKTLFQPGKYT